MENDQAISQETEENKEKKEEEDKNVSEASEKTNDSEKVQVVIKKFTMLSPTSSIVLKKAPDPKQSKTDPTASPETKPSGSATGNPRNKTALAPGHSLMDWIRLGSSGTDLTGVGGQIKSITPAEMAQHNEEKDAWIAIQGLVFNVSQYMDFHPGGVEELMKGAGKDATKLFNDVHPWVNYQSILQKCFVGKLEYSTNAAHAFKSDSKK